MTTLCPGSPATVNVSFDGASVHFAFAIPAGADGVDGADGADGAPGEVTQAALATAIDGTSANSNGVALLNLNVSNPPTQAEMQSIADKLDEVIAALRR